MQTHIQYQIPDLAMVALGQLVTHTFPAHISSSLLVFPAPPKEIIPSWTSATRPTSRETQAEHRILYVIEIKADLQKPVQVSMPRGGRRTPVSVWPPLTGAAEVRASFDLAFTTPHYLKKDYPNIPQRREAPGSQMKVREFVPEPGTNAFCLKEGK